MTIFRTRVVRPDGRAINVVQHRAHLSYCFTGCCCGRTERGYAAVPVDAFKDEWLRLDIPVVQAVTSGMPREAWEVDHTHAVGLIREIV